TGPVRVARDEDALPRRQRSVQVAADHFDTALQRLDLAIARVGARLLFQCVDFLQQRRNRFLEFERFDCHLHLGIATKPRKHETYLSRFRVFVCSWPHRNSTDPAPTTCSTSATSADEGATRICAVTSTVTRSRCGASPASSSNDTRRSPRWRAKIAPRASSTSRSAGRFK